MNEDPIVEEPRRAGKQYVESFNGDWSALAEDLRRRAEREGRTPVSLPPRLPRQQRPPERKVG
jgi:hypothetical protein